MKYTRDGSFIEWKDGLVSTSVNVCNEHVAQTLVDRLNAIDAALSVIAEECYWWQASEHLRKNEPHNEFAKLADARAATRRNALADDAIKESRP